MTVREDLGLHVAWLVEVALHEALTPAEGRGRLAHGALEQLGQFVGAPGDLEPAPTATERRLDRYWQPVLVGEGHNLVDAGDGVGGTRCQRRTHGEGDVTGRGLVAQAPDRLGRRSDPGQTRLDDRLGEVGVFREEAVPGMDRVGAACPADIEDLVDPQVGVARCAARESVRLVGNAYVESLYIGLGVHRDAGISGVAACADDPDSDLSPVGDEDLTHVSPVLVQRG